MSKVLVRIETSEMKKALDVCGSVIQSKNALPILGDIVLRYQKEQNLFQMLASNSEQFICLDCAAPDKEGNRQPWLLMIEQDRKEPFADVAIPHAALREAIATLPIVPSTRASCFCSIVTNVFCIIVLLLKMGCCFTLFFFSAR